MAKFFISIILLVNSILLSFKKSIKILYCISLVFLSDLCYSQELHDVYEGGPERLNGILREHIRINHDKQIAGIGIIEFSVSGNGTVEGKILSTVNDFTTDNYLEVIPMIESGWIITGYDYQMRISILYNIDSNELNSLEAQVPGFSKLLGMFSNGGKVSTTSLDDFTYTPKVKKARDEITTLINASEFEKAYTQANELLKYIPIDSELVEQRIMLEEKLGLSQFKEFDQNLINSFYKMINGTETTSTEPTGLDTLYNGGITAYSNSLRENLYYPELSIKDKIQGTVIYSITVDTSAIISAKLLTLLDKEIESIIISAINVTSKDWIAQKKPYTIYQAVTFCDSFEFAEVRAESVEHDIEKVAYPALPHVTIYSGKKSITTERKSLGYQRSSVGYQSSASATQQQTAPRPRTNSYAARQKVGYTPNMKRLIKNLEKAQTKNKPEQEFEILSELIRYDPMNLSYIQRRYELGAQLQETSFKAYDLAWFKALNWLLAN
jgi:hypothetical protein